MKKKKLNHIELETLKWINSEREISGAEPIKKIRKGKKGSPDSCPVANSLFGKVYVSDAIVSYARGGRMVCPSAETALFIRAFDNGKYEKYNKYKFWKR